MARGRTLSYTALALLSLTFPASSYEDLWHVDIAEGPAPPPSEGPPLSFNADRNHRHLRYEVAAILGSYIGTVLLLGTLLLTVGRKMRKRALSATASQIRSTEMVKPMNYAFDPSPISPASARSWYSPRKLRTKKSAASSIRSGLSNPVSPDVGSVLSFDAGVIEADRARRAEEMERLYAAVMAQDDRKPTPGSKTASASATPVMGAPSKPTEGVPPPSYSRKKPPRLLTDAPSLRHLQPGQQQGLYPNCPTSPLSPMTPKSPVRAIYPPERSSNHAEHHPRAPLSPLYPSQSSDHCRERSASASAISSSEPSSSRPQKKRKGLRTLRISTPLPPNEDNSDGARTPLSPRFYTDPGVPPEPPSARTTDSTTLSYSPPASPEIPHHYADRNLPRARGPPLPAPQRPTPAAPYNYANTPQAATNTSARAPPFSSPPPRIKTNATASSPNAPLPLRQYTWNTPSTQYIPPSTTHPQTNAPPSAGPVKTTFITTRSRLGGGLGTGGLATGAATPYSPYMPFTPLTPVTPRLTTRRERRQREREERGMGLGRLEEGDAVKDEGEIWGDGY